MMFNSHSIKYILQLFIYHTWFFVVFSKIVVLLHEILCAFDSFLTYSQNYSYLVQVYQTVSLGGMLQIFEHELPAQDNSHLHNMSQCKLGIQFFTQLLQFTDFPQNRCSTELQPFIFID